MGEVSRKGTSEIALANLLRLPSVHAVFPALDGQAMHDFWLFEGLLPTGNGRLHVTASHYDDPIATELVKNALRCISLHGCTDAQAKGKIQMRSGLPRVTGAMMTTEYGMFFEAGDRRCRRARTCAL